MALNLTRPIPIRVEALGGFFDITALPHSNAADDALVAQLEAAADSSDDAVERVNAQSAVLAQFIAEETQSVAGLVLGDGAEVVWPDDVASRLATLDLLPPAVTAAWHLAIRMGAGEGRHAGKPHE